MVGRRKMRAVGAVAAMALVVVAGCGDDDEDEASTDTTAPAAETTAPAGDDGGSAGGAIEVTARDYEFEGVPDTVPAGSTFSFSTEDGGEPHEFLVIKLPDGETRSIDELIELPESEIEPLFAGLQFVTIAMPGTTDTPGVVEPAGGESSVSEPGNYVYVCSFPQGTTVEDVQNATGPLEGAGPPHFVLGMRGEFTVE